MDDFRPLLDSIYLSTAGRPGAFSSPERLFQEAKTENPRITRSTVNKYLRSVKSYSQHARVLRKFPTRKYLALFPGEYWQMDIIYLNTLKNISSQKVHNQPNYALIAIDVFTLRAYGELMARKTAADTLLAFQKMLADSKTVPSLLHVDRGSEFFSAFLVFCKEQSIKVYSTTTKFKASRVEVLNSTLKLTLHRMLTQFNSSDIKQYFPVALKIYNNTSSKGLPQGITPNKAANPDNIPKIQHFYLRRRALWAKKMKTRHPRSKFKVGDRVRKTEEADSLGPQRGHKIKFSTKVYEVVSITKTLPRMYHIGIFKAGKQRAFYGSELRIAEERTTDAPRIEAIISSKKQPLTHLRSGKVKGSELIYLVAVEGDAKNRYLNSAQLEEYINGSEMLKSYNSHGD